MKLSIALLAAASASVLLPANAQEHGTGPERSVITVAFGAGSTRHNRAIRLTTT